MVYFRLVDLQIAPPDGRYRMRLDVEPALPSPLEPVRGSGRPVFLVSSPRSGTNLLADRLAQASGLAALGPAAQEILQGIGALHPSWRGWESGRLTAEDASPASLSIVRLLREGCAARLRSHGGDPATRFL